MSVFRAFVTITICGVALLATGHKAFALEMSKDELAIAACGMQVFPIPEPGETADLKDYNFGALERDMFQTCMYDMGFKMNLPDD